MHLVGIEISCAGLVTPDGSGNFTTYWGGHVPQDQVRVVADRDNQKGGAYHVYTDAQEAALFDLLVWLKLNGSDVFDTSLVLGHDEVSPGRKIDPGGSLSMTMPALRERLRTMIVGTALG